MKAHGRPFMRLEFEGEKAYLVLGQERLTPREQAEFVARFNGEVPHRHRAKRSGALAPGAQDSRGKK